ncbi:putative NADPH2 dehydrogenase chain OYE2 [Cylindrobasidium torrendii FP15055 ss-10]|uniref:Putative NADPH2 dehydrogenase chain OYE2 n=1 Tax=Cylindrobasidium torrendii FP15055 ss-10 TaxID=1314674 RepID=A0A0D7AVN3_9AGAR|nr:putative NADPH2 dehydrogenase chain OYE2 [Cylindrobasidium torrendii FP15055 ss-10]
MATVILRNGSMDISEVSSSKLFQPINVGHTSLQHRIVLAPLTRLKATKTTHVPHTVLVTEYYSQRASTPGTLLITEATIIGPQVGGVDNAPGIWSQEQIEAWKEVTDTVHAKRSFIFSQIWALGPTENPDTTSDQRNFDAPSSMKISPCMPPLRELTQAEIRSIVKSFADAAHNAVNGAGFDGVEIHGANGYLIDQFLQDTSNQRTDIYGGSIENRTRFGLEVVDAVVNRIGAEHTAIRLSPWTGMYGLRMKDPRPTFSFLVSKIKKRHPNLAYIHVIEPRADLELEEGTTDDALEEWDSGNDFLRDIWAPRPYISAGNYTSESARAVADNKGDLIAFGRAFLANPDLPVRLKSGLKLNSANRDTFYVPGEHPEGYIDYPFAR